MLVVRGEFFDIWEVKFNGGNLIEHSKYRKCCFVNETFVFQISSLVKHPNISQPAQPKQRLRGLCSVLIFLNRNFGFDELLTTSRGRIVGANIKEICLEFTRNDGNNVYVPVRLEVARDRS